MKKTYYLFLILSLLISLWGCSANRQKPEGSVTFYYQRSNINPEESNSAIATDSRVLPDNANDNISILNTYLQGPVTDPLHKIFPTGITLVSLDLTNENAVVILGGTYATLSGMEQTMFCACMTLTVCDLTGTKQVTIHRAQELPEGGNAITMRPEEIVLWDDCKIEIDHD